MKKPLMRAEEELERLYRRHVDTVYRVCFLFLKNKSDTEDMVQNTFLKLMRYSGGFESEEHEKAWLIVTASNLCRDTLKHWWRKTCSIEQPGAEQISGQSDPAEHAAERDRSESILQQVLALPDLYKTPLYLYYYEDYSTAQIAKLLRKKEATVRSLLSRGRKQLQKQLESRGLDG